MSRVTEGCATMAMSTNAGARQLNPAMLTPGSPAEGRGTATRTRDQSGGVPFGAPVDDTSPV
ncbi:hypothetical protein ACWDF1_04240 [Streptomyces coelicoflavus]|uniref:hypothetical protein n=1 Tax=Streptomyces coelicoflavus TaxID=285562 RepID=UPI0036D18A76